MTVTEPKCLMKEKKEIRNMSRAKGGLTWEVEAECHIEIQRQGPMTVTMTVTVTGARTERTGEGGAKP